MNNLFSRQFAMLLRVRAFGSRHASLFPPAGVAGQLFAVIEAAIPELSKNAGMHAAGAGLGREHVAARSAARESLRQCMDAISRTARAIVRKDYAILKEWESARRVASARVPKPSEPELHRPLRRSSPRGMGQFAHPAGDRRGSAS